MPIPPVIGSAGLAFPSGLRRQRDDAVVNPFTLHPRSGATRRRLPKGLGERNLALILGTLGICALIGGAIGALAGGSWVGRTVGLIVVLSGVAATAAMVRYFRRPFRA